MRYRYIFWIIAAGFSAHLFNIRYVERTPHSTVPAPGYILAGIMALGGFIAGQLRNNKDYGLSPIETDAAYVLILMIGSGVIQDLSFTCCFTSIAAGLSIARAIKRGEY